MTVKIKLARANGALVSSPANSPTVVATAVSDLIGQYSNTSAVLEYDGITYANAVSYVNGKAYVNSSVNVIFTGVHVHSSNVGLNAGLIANGSIGTSGQILKSNGANVYWADGGTGTVTQIDTANGLSGGPIITSGTIGIIANSGIHVNTSGVFVNSSYISTLASNSASFLGNSSGTIANISSWVISNASASYSNAVSYVDGKAYVNTSQLSSNLVNYQTIAGLASNVSTLTSNNATYAYGKNEVNLNVNNALTANSSAFLETANLQNIQTYITSNASAAYSNAVSYVDGKAYVNTSQLSSNLANYALLTGAIFSGNVRTQQSAQVDGNLVVSGNLTVSGNVVIIGANNLSVVDNMIYLNSNSNVSNPDLGFAGNYNDGVYRHTGFFRDASDGIWKIFDSYLPEPDASPYIDTTNSSFKIANFQANIVYVGNTTVYSTINTTSFSGTANNATYAYGKTEVNLNVNNALTANSSTFLGIANLSNIQTFITSNAATAYTNSVAYVDGKSYVNTSQLSSNLANYQTSAGLAANVATLTSNSASYLGNSSGTLANISSWITSNSGTAYTNAVSYVDGKSYVNTSQLSSNLANYQTTAGLASNVATLTANNANNLGGIPAASYVNTSGSYTITGMHTYSNGITFSNTITANGSNGATGQVLTSSGTSGNVYWSTPSGGGGVSTGKAIAMAMIFG